MSERGPIQAVTFDLDDTLYPEMAYVASGYHAVSDYLQLTQARDEPFEDWLWYRFTSGQAGGAFDALNEEFDLGLTGEDIAELVTVYRKHTPAIHPYDGMPELLDHIGRSCRLALLSDGYLPAQRLKLEALGLSGKFQSVVFTEQLGREFWKPSPAGFEKIATDLSVPHEACCYVSDNPAKDFVAPNALGWRTIRYDRPGQVHRDKPAAEGGQPHVTVTADAELLAALGLD